MCQDEQKLYGDFEFRNNSLNYLEKIISEKNSESNFVFKKYFLKSLNHISHRTKISTLLTASIFWLLNPIIVIENEKFYFGLTKDVSLIFPFIKTKTMIIPLKAGVEYSVLFRKSQLNHMRASLELLIPVETGDFFAFLLATGGGYFTDFNKNGVSAQLSPGFLLPVTDSFGVNAYLKLRHTFVFKHKGDLTDLSLGLGLYLYPFN